MNREYDFLIRNSTNVNKKIMHWEQVKIFK